MSTYTGGQEPIVHLEIDLYGAIDWAENENLRWAFTLGNASASYVEDRTERSALTEIDWDAVNTIQWSGSGVDSSVKEKKQAELLIEDRFPWHRVSALGIAQSQNVSSKVNQVLQKAAHKPPVQFQPNWYY